MIRKANAVWRGAGRDGAGAFTSPSGVLTIPGIDNARFQAIAAEAEKGCPVSKVLNAEVTLNATLES